MKILTDVQTEMKYPVSKILSINVSRLDLDETTQVFSSWIDSKAKRRVCVTSVNCLLAGRRNKKLKDVYNSSDLNLADGVPIVWASRALGEPIHGRVTGLDLLPVFSQVSAEREYSFFFLGAKDGVAEALKTTLTKKYPTLRVVGVYSPPFADEFSNEEDAKIVQMINAVKPNVLWVSLTAPKQDFWIEKNFERLDVNIAIGVGGAFEVTAGIIARSPKWMQKSGLEWLFRFLQEPRRLFRRYFIEAPVFIPLILFQKLGVLKE